MGQVRERTAKDQAAGKEASKHLPRYPTLLNGSTVFDNPSTEFSITTVNFPDRLDVQEVRARAEEDERPRRRLYIDWYPFKLWAKRLIFLGVLGAIGYYGWQASRPLRDEMRIDSIAARLSKALGQPVAIADGSFKFQPTPRFVLADVSLGSDIKLNEVSLQFNWRDAWRALQGGGWIWGEATVAPMQLTLAQAQSLLGSVAPLGSGVPATISTVRFEELQFPGSRLMPGKYQAVVRRDASGAFGAVELTERGIDGSMKMTVASIPAEAGANGIEFSLDAARWKAPFGPQVPWTEARATGTWNGQVLEVLDYLLVGYYGSVRGLAYAASDVAWAVTGTARGSNIDIDSVFQSLRNSPQKDADGNPPKAPMQGTAEMSLLFGGHGASLEEAAAQTVVEGPVEVRWAILNGINLGYAATRPGTLAGGVTRFSEFGGEIRAKGGQVAFRDLSAKAGAMATRGDVTVSPDLGLSGSLRVDLGATRVQAPINVRVKGSALAPEFGR